MSVEPFAVLWALGIVLAHIMYQVTQSAGLASLNRGTAGSVMVNLTEGALASSLFPSSCIVYLCPGPALFQFLSEMKP